MPKYYKYTSLFGQSVKLLRLQQNLTQADLANRMGTNRNYIVAVEKGKGNPTLTKIIDFAYALEIRTLILLSFLDD